jgi:3-deoxy-7-phosphoheptulonate synthase
MGAEGIELLKLARAETGLPIVSEIMDASQLPLFDDVDVIQVGARNMQNFNLLKILGAQEKPVMIKRGLSSTYEEWLMSAEYVMASGNTKVILCERGIRTFETYTRNTLDLAAVPVLRHLTHLPIIIDPSHATGRNALVAPLALGAVATGCDGLLIEVHNDPAHALSDGPQSLNPEAFDALNRRILALHAFMTAGEGRA